MCETGVCTTLKQTLQGILIGIQIQTSLLNKFYLELITNELVDARKDFKGMLTGHQIQIDMLCHVKEEIQSMLMGNVTVTIQLVVP